MKNVKRVLVTGSCGFIGFHLANKLSELDIEVHCVDDFSNSSFDESYKKLISKANVHHHHLNLEIDDLHGLDQDFDVVFHLAAKNGTANFYEKPFDVIKSGIQPTLKLLDHLKNNKGVFLLASTSENYAGGVNKFSFPIPTPEDVPLVVEDIKNTRWSYASAKILSEAAVIAAETQFGAKFVIARIHNVYGPRMGFKHFVPDYMSRIIKHEFLVYGPEQTRSFLYVDDACRILFELAVSESSINKIVNVGSDSENTIGDVCTIINQIAGVDEEIQSLAAPVGSVGRRIPDLTQLRSMIQDFERTPLRVGLSHTWDYYKQLIQKE